MITKNTIISLDHCAMYDYGKGLKATLTLGELVTALEKYKKSNNNSDIDEFISGFLESGIIKTEKYLDPTAQCAIVSFSLVNQRVSRDEKWLKERNLTVSDLRDMLILQIDLDWSDPDRVYTDVEGLESLESFKKLRNTFKAGYILDFFKEVLGCYCDIQDIVVHGKEISIGKGDIYQDPENCDPRNNIEPAWWIKYDSEWLMVLDSRNIKAKEAIIDYLRNTESEHELESKILDII